MTNKPAYHEDWERKTTPDGYPCVVCSGGDNAQFNSGAWAQAELAAAAPKLVRALLAVEWAGDEFGERCPACEQVNLVFRKNMRAPEHRGGCELDAALTAACLPDQPSRDKVRAEIAEAKR